MNSRRRLDPLDIIGLVAVVVGLTLALLLDSMWWGIAGVAVLFVCDMIAIGLDVAAAARRRRRINS